MATSHSFTGRMCAAARWLEGRRPDSLFEDPLGHRLAGVEGRRSPMGDWIMTPRTRFGDDLLRDKYSMGCRQLVLLGAGMDSRAYRMAGLEDLAVFEVDQKTTFDVKEPLLENEAVAVRSRVVVPTDFTERGAWARALVDMGYDAQVPTVWLLEGLLMYLSIGDTKHLMSEIGRLSPPGSVAFHDAVTATYVNERIVVGGAPFIGGSDEYRRLWAEYAGFSGGHAYDFNSIWVNRAKRRVEVDPREPEATPARCRGRNKVLFVVAEK